MTPHLSEGAAGADQLVRDLTEAGVQLWEEDGRLRFRAPKGVLTEAHTEALRANRDAVLEALRAPAPTVLTPAPADRFEPFPVTDVQASYLLGRRSVFAYGGVSCHGYGELSYDELDPARLAAAWNALIRRHDMLRVVVAADGAQQVLPEVPDYRIDVVDVRGQSAQRAAEAVEEGRAELSHRVYQTDQWPLFGMRITQADEVSVLHFSIDFLIADFVSIEVILDELHRLYADPDAELPALGLAYRDYRLAEQRLRSGAGYERDKRYWLDRIDDLPGAPDLPVRTRPEPRGFRRWETVLDETAWAGFRERAGRHGVSPSCAVLAAFTETIGAWSRASRYCVNVTLLNRAPLHPDVDRLVGDFTSVSLLAVDKAAGPTFADRAAAGQAQLWLDLDHRGFSGVEVIREIGRRSGAEAALMPVVFTSAIGLQPGAAEQAVPRGRLTYGISQTPQVWIDCQNIERGPTLVSNWDVRDGVLPDAVVEAAFQAYADLLGRLAADDGAWRQAHPLDLPADQARRRAEVNATEGPLPDGLLHDGFFAAAARHPERVAVVAGDRSFGYGELMRRADALAARLLGRGLAPAEPVAVVMDKGWEQVVAVLAVLRAGGAYLPVDTNQPAARRARILQDAGVRFGVTQEWLAAEAGPGDWEVVEDALPEAVAPDAAAGPRAAADDLAYVIYTSGSTGAPKGVMISHRAARNTVDDVTARFGVGAGDRVLGLAALGFDLSVYDVFGLLAVGGALVLPDARRRADPSHWAGLIAEHGVTLWNSVPAQLQMLADYLDAAPAVTLPTLRLALLSGDWIPVGLPDQIRDRVPGLAVVSLGGATEAAIWSIHHEIGAVPPEWTSIPYGRPLTNQTFHVLDAVGRPCPDGVAGELHIGGAGLALGYLNDPERTAERFITHATTGERLYRTGDLGRYLPDGEIEFLGREDFQVKIRGHRIELAEIEAALAGHPDVDAAACVVEGVKNDRRLAAFVEPRRIPAPADTAAPRALADAAQTAAKVLDGVDTDRYLGYTRLLDDIALTAMIGVFVEAGLFSDGAAHTEDEILDGARVAPRYHRLVRRWLHTLRGEGLLAEEAGLLRLTPDGTARTTVDQADVWDEIVDLSEGVDDVRLIDYFRANAARLRELIRGDDDPLRILFPDGRVDVSDDLYSQALFNRWANTVTADVLRDLVAACPGPDPVRVLEVGAGAGGTSAGVLAALAEAAGREVDYLYTDISQFFLNAAAERFAGRPGLRFGVFDIDRDFRAQGLSANSFDLVLAGDVLHASKDVGAALERLAELLAPGGHLVVQEMTRDHVQAMTSLELMVRFDEAVGDFADERRGRHQTFLTPAQWQRLLTAAGADAVHSVPDGDALLDEIGMRVYTARFKADRAPITARQIAGHLAGEVPEYMVPALIEVVDALPVTDNGKIDRTRMRGWIPARGGAAPIVEEDASELETELAALWASALRVERVGRGQDFLELGGDSLLAAQLAGRLLEELPMARGMFFDEVLRLILERLTVAGLAAGLLEAAAAAGQAETGDPAAAPAVESVVELGGSGDAPAWVLVHDGTGLLRPYPALADRLGAGAPVLGLVGSAGLAVADLAPQALLDRLADRYAAGLGGRGPVRVVGHGLGAPLAFEVARRLTESGADVAGLALIAPETPDCRVEDEGLAGYLFARRFGVDPADLGLPGEPEVARAVEAVRLRTPGRIGPSALAGLAADADEALRATGAAFAAWDKLPAADRVAAIADALPGGPDVTTLGSAYELYRTLLVAVADLDDVVYADDATLVLPAEPGAFAALHTEPRSHWEKRCLGDVVVRDVAGDRHSCMQPPHVAELAAALTATADGAR